MNHSLSMTAIAKICKVSTMTVSRAFRRNSYVAPAVRARILKAAAKMNYHSDGWMGRPRGQSKKSGMTVRVIVGELIGGDNIYHAYLLGSIERMLAQHRCDCHLQTCDSDYSNFNWLCDTLRSENNVPTMIVGYFPVAKIHALMATAPGALLVDYTEDPRLTHHYNCAGFDNIEAGRIAVRHLLEIGRKRVLLVKGHRDHFFSIEIESGYCDVLRQNGIKLDNALVVSADFTAAGGYQRVMKILKCGLDFDAVFTNDEMALGVMRALAEKGREIPGDVAVVGCDGLPYGSFLRPSLTSIIMDHAELGRTAVEYLLSRNTSKSAVKHIRLLPKLIVRESTLGFEHKRSQELK